MPPASQDGRKRPKYSKKSKSGKRKQRPIQMTTTQFAEAQAPPDKKFVRKEERRQQREKLAALRQLQEEEDARLLAELQSEGGLLRAVATGRKILRALCCCFCAQSSKKQLSQKFTAKTEAQLESEKMQKWMSDKRDVVMVEAMFAVRALERESQRRYRALTRIFGGDSGRELDQSADLLRASCLNGRYKEVLDALEDGDFTANSVNSSGDTAFFAVVNRALDGAGGEVDHDDDDNQVALGCWAHLKRRATAIVKKPPLGRLDLILKILTVRGGDVNFVRVTKDKFEDGYGLVHEAAKGNREGLLEWLVSREVDVNILTSQLRKTALMVAAEGGHGEMLRTLLHRGCIDTIHNVDWRGWNVLHYAAAFCDSQFVKMLLMCGADLGVRSAANRLPLEEAQSRGRMENVAVLMFHKDRSRMFTHRILFFDKHQQRQHQQHLEEVEAEAGGGGLLGMGGLRKLGEFY